MWVGDGSHDRHLAQHGASLMVICSLTLSSGAFFLFVCS